MTHPVYGLLAIGGSHIDAHNAWPLRGLLTFGGEGRDLTERWLGVDTGGTGQVDVVGINYSGSLGRILSRRQAVRRQRPGPAAQRGRRRSPYTRTHEHCAATRPPASTTASATSSASTGCTPSCRYMAAGLRFDRVVPNSKDSSETFHVLAARLVFKTDWQSRESIMLLYAKWFYGPNTHPEATAPSTLRLPRLDDQLIAVNVNMWW